jgi:sulfatase modifying factor 1
VTLRRRAFPFVTATTARGAIAGALVAGVGCAPRGVNAPAASPLAPPGARSPSREGEPPPPSGGAPSVSVQPTPEPDTRGAPRPLAPQCPPEMALVPRPIGPFCADRWEATLLVTDSANEERPWPPNRIVDPVADRVRAQSVPGVIPQGYVSGVQAAAACERSGKRLCSVDEWVRACRGPARTLYPYGEVRRAGVCNDRFRVLDRHPVVRLFQREAPPGTNPDEMWSPRWMNDPRLFELDATVVPTGSMTDCTNPYGVYDMVGNLHEWVADPEGTFFGGFFMDTFQNGEGCSYRTTFHPADYHDYSTGFRCCADALPAPTGPTRD